VTFAIRETVWLTAPVPVGPTFGVVALTMTEKPLETPVPVGLGVVAFAVIGAECVWTTK